jgi:16S rRNA (uracil1498-N3)-methyltransferase
VNTFYFNGLLKGTVQLDGDEAHHLSHVLRLKPGDFVRLVNGMGAVAKASVESISKKEVWVTVGECRIYDPPFPKLNICIAPTKNIDRMEWFAEKATEMGISSITPVICRRSERKDLRLPRLNKLVLSAAKQSGQTWFPEIHPVRSFDSYMESPLHESGFIAWCGEGEKTELKMALSPPVSVTLLIGPEGDFTHEEVMKAIGKGYRPLSLGGSRLRTETAALAAVAAFRVFHPIQ